MSSITYIRLPYDDLRTPSILGVIQFTFTVLKVPYVVFLPSRPGLLLVRSSGLLGGELTQDLPSSPA